MSYSSVSHLSQTRLKLHQAYCNSFRSTDVDGASTTGREATMDDRETSPKVTRLIGILTCSVFCGAALLLAVVSTGTLLLALSNLRPAVNQQSNKSSLSCATLPRVDNTSSPAFLQCVALPRNELGQYRDVDVSTLTCISAVRPLQQQIESSECFVHRVMWGWSLLLMVCIPYVFVVVRNLRRLCLNSKKHPTTIDYRASAGLVLLVETLYAVGVSVLVFVAMPASDNVFEVSGDRTKSSSSS